MYKQGSGTLVKKTKKDITDLETYFQECLYFTSTVMHRVINEMSEEAFASTSLNPSYAFLMMVACEKGNATVGEAAKILRLAPSTVTRFADKLVTKKYLIKEQKGRNVIIRPTKKGKELLPLIEKAWHKLYLNYCEILGENAAVKLTANMAKANKKLQT